MANDSTERASLFQETWGAVNASRSVWAPWVAGITVLAMLAQWFIPVSQPEIFKQLHDNPQLLKQHPELQGRYMQAVFDVMTTLAPYLLIGLLVYAVFYYAILVSYLRFAMTKSQPEYSIGGFFYWFGRVLWKYIRPVLWMLIPLIGPFFYIRSTVRYATVSPLAILGRGPELQNSWEMTEGNWWRIFLNQIGVTLVLILFMWAVALIPLIVLLIVAHGDAHSPLYRGGAGLINGISTGLGLMVGVVYGCTVYRVLLKERKQAA